MKIKTAVSDPITLKALLRIFDWCNLLVSLGEKPVARGGISQAKKEAEFVPTWSHGLPAKEGPSSSKKQKTDWDDSVLDQMMVEYSESIE